MENIFNHQQVREIDLLESRNELYHSRVYQTASGINPLIATCDPILTLSVNLRTLSFINQNREELQQGLIHEIQAFTDRAQLAGYSPSTLMLARYLLCALLDEAMLSTDWGRAQDWQAVGLLSFFYGEGRVDEKLWGLVDPLLKNIRENIEVLELVYLCLNLGLAEQQSNPHELLSRANQLYQAITQFRQAHPQNLLLGEASYEAEVQPKLTDQHNPSSAAYSTSKVFFISAILLALLLSGTIYWITGKQVDHYLKETYQLSLKS